MSSTDDTLNNKEKRRYARIKTINDIGYVLLDENMNTITAGKGHILDLSQGGALLKTEEPIRGVFVLLVTIDLEGKKIKLKARLRHTRRDDSSSFFLTGIEFVGPKEEQTRAIVSFVKAYQYRKHVMKETH
jgi:c-di-GMP-binding flagellar brake protein YcgR